MEAVDCGIPSGMNGNVSKVISRDPVQLSFVSGLYRSIRSFKTMFPTLLHFVLTLGGRAMFLYGQVSGPKSTA